MEKMIKKKGYGAKGRYLEFLKAHARAGFPRHFRWNGTQQIVDRPTLREQLERRLETPLDKQIRLEQGRNELTLKMLKCRL